MTTLTTRFIGVLLAGMILGWVPMKTTRILADWLGIVGALGVVAWHFRYAHRVDHGTLPVKPITRLNIE
jgi:hypothetical protein